MLASREPRTVCESDEACEDLITRDPASSLRGGGSTVDDDLDQPVCYKEGFGVKEMYQMCDVTSESSPNARANWRPRFRC